MLWLCFLSELNSEYAITVENFTQFPFIADSWSQNIEALFSCLSPFGYMQIQYILIQVVYHIVKWHHFCLKKNFVSTFKYGMSIPSKYTASEWECNNDYRGNNTDLTETTFHYIVTAW